MYIYARDQTHAQNAILNLTITRPQLQQITDKKMHEPYAYSIIKENCYAIKAFGTMTNILKYSQIQLLKFLPSTKNYCSEESQVNCKA